MHETVERRRTRAEFIARGLASRDEARHTGVYFCAQSVHDELRTKLAKAWQRVPRWVDVRYRVGARQDLNQ